MLGPCLKKERRGGGSTQRSLNLLAIQLPPQTKGSSKAESSIVPRSQIRYAGASQEGHLFPAAFAPGGEHLLRELSYLGIEKQVSSSRSIPQHPWAESVDYLVPHSSAFAATAQL